jgi:hypothetical protein
MPAEQRQTQSRVSSEGTCRRAAEAGTSIIGSPLRMRQRGRRPGLMQRRPASYALARHSTETAQYSLSLGGEWFD